MKTAVGILSVLVVFLAGVIVYPHAKRKFEDVRGGYMEVVEVGLSTIDEPTGIYPTMDELSEAIVNANNGFIDTDAKLASGEVRVLEIVSYMARVRVLGGEINSGWVRLDSIKKNSKTRIK